MYKLSFYFLLASSCIVAQNNQPDVLMKGPINILDGGVVDGVIENEEIIQRSKIDYEYVRRADYVWSKRVFSRIDGREKINHVLFFPPDKFLEDFTETPPQNLNELENAKSWVRHRERRSLWTIIAENLMSGELTMYLVSDSLDFNFAMEDGYSFKYPLIKPGNSSSPYFDNGAYRSMINKRIGIFQNGSTWFGSFKGNDNFAWETIPSITSFKEWCDTLSARDKDINEVGADWSPGVQIDMLDPKFEQAWNRAMVITKSSGVPVNLEKLPKTYFLTSDMIVSYNIKEDWFFDKERSILDRRIIAIAPVAKFTIDSSKISGRGGLLVKSPVNGKFEAADLSGKKISITNNTKLAEHELFWLYFPDLRDVLVNYFVYNENSDSQWMSFDDLFWKRKFSSTIYRVSDKFDREIEDYKYGVDALYESERIKDDIRTWEIDVWNY